MFSYGYTKLDTPVLVRSRKLSNLGHAGLALGCVTIQGFHVDAVASKYCKIPEAEKPASGAKKRYSECKYSEFMPFSVCVPSELHI